MKTKVALLGDTFTVVHENKKISSVHLPGDFLNITEKIKGKSEYVNALKKKGYSF